MDLLGINADFFHMPVLSGLMCFLLLVALAMVLINPVIVVWPVLFATVMPLIIGNFEYKTSYISIARSVCRIE